MLIAHLSDLHIDTAQSVNTRRLQAVLAKLAQTQPRPALTLVTGDLTQEGSPEQYALLRTLLRDSGPYALLPGNHDDAECLHRLFPEAAPRPGGMLCLDLAGLRLMLVDSSVERQDHGKLGETLLRDMALECDSDPRPTLVAMHHPPIPAQVPALDDMGLRETESFQAWAAKRTCITAILAGHYHQTQFSMLGRCCPVIVAPPVALPTIADFTARSFQVEDTAPAIVMHLWRHPHFSSHLFVCDRPQANLRDNP